MWTKEKQKAVSRKHYLLNKEKVLERSKKWATDNPEKLYAKYLRHIKKHPLKKKARDAVRYALITGKLIKQPCHCGEKKVEAHHEDYSKPLDVTWLCFKHHRELDQSNKNSRDGCYQRTHQSQSQKKVLIHMSQ